MDNSLMIVLGVVTIIVNIFVAIGTIGAVVVAIHSIRKTDLRDEKRVQQEKIEQILLLIADIFSSLDNVIKVHRKEFFQIPLYDDNPVLRFDADIRNIQMKTVHAGVLIRAYIGTVESFKEAVLLLNGTGGYFDKRKNFFLPMMNEIKKGKINYTEQETQEKQNLDEELGPILEKSLQLFQNAHFELIEKLKNVSK
ncbi:MAG: hypothetical protein ACNA7Y_02380 [Gammaproteobacteria bacterium]